MIMKPPIMVQSRFAETLTLTLTPNPNFGDSGFGETGRHHLKLFQFRLFFYNNVSCEPAMFAFAKSPEVVSVKLIH